MISVDMVVDSFNQSNFCSKSHVNAFYYCKLLLSITAQNHFIPAQISRTRYEKLVSIPKLLGSDFRDFTLFCFKDIEIDIIDPLNAARNQEVSQLSRYPLSIPT